MSGVFEVSGLARVTYLRDVNDTGREMNLELESCATRAESAEQARDNVLLAAVRSFEHVLDAVWLQDPEVRELGEDEVMRRMGQPALFELGVSE
jgi:hypothetical protein